MFKKSLIAAGMALALASGAAVAAGAIDNSKEMTFELTANIRGPIFKAVFTDNPQQQNSMIAPAKGSTPNGNPTFDPLSVTLEGGDTDVQAKLIDNEILLKVANNDDKTISMQAKIEGRQLSMDAIDVATVDELTRTSGKKIDIMVTPKDDTKAPLPGKYTGSFSVVFEPKLDSL